MAAPVIASTTAVGSSSNEVALTVPMPSGTSSGDLLIAILGVQDTTPLISLPVGWTELDKDQRGQASCLIAWKIAGASEPSISAEATDSAADRFSGVVLRVTGSDGTVIFAAPNSNFSNSMTHLTATAAENDSLDLLIGVYHDDHVETYPAGYAQDARANNGNRNTIYVASDVVSSGATGTETVTLPSNENHFAYRIILTPDAGGPATITGTAAASLSDFTAASSGTVQSTITGTSAVTLSALAVASSGTVTTGPQTITGTSASTLSGLSITTDGVLEVTGDASANVSLSVSADGARVVDGSAAMVIGAITASASGSVGAQGDVTVTLDAMSVAGSGRRIINAAGDVSTAAIAVASSGARAVDGSAAMAVGAIETNLEQSPVGQSAVDLQVSVAASGFVGPSKILDFNLT